MTGWSDGMPSHAPTLTGHDDCRAVSSISDSRSWENLEDRGEVGECQRVVRSMMVIHCDSGYKVVLRTYEFGRWMELHTARV